MTNEKSVILIGLDPELVDFSVPGIPPGMDAAKVRAGVKASEDELTRLGYSVATCFIDFGATAEAVVEAALKQKAFACVMIGAGVRTVPANFLLFEKLVNVAHRHAPQARICFNTLPSDTAAAVKRWV